MIIKCKTCNKEFNISPSRIKTKKFCSFKCHMEFRKKHHGILWIKRICKNCKKEFEADYNQAKLGYYKFCSNKCKHEWTRGKNSPSYKGGWVRPDEYRQVSKDGKPYLEHRLIMGNHIGRKLNTDETVHHKDRNRLNNNIENLQILKRPIHCRLHSKGRKMSKDTIQKLKQIAKTRKRDKGGMFIC